MVRLLLLMLVGLSVSFAACQKREPAKVTAEEVREKAAQAAGAATDYAKQEKEDYIGKVQKEMDELEAELDALKTEARKTTAKAKAKLDGEIKVSEDKWKTAERKFTELKSTGADAWESMKAGVDKAMDDLKQSFARNKKQ